MITGDRKETAEAVAQELGLLTNKSILESSELAKLSDEQLQDRLPTIGVVARALPMDKYRLVHCPINEQSCWNDWRWSQ